MRPCVLSIAVLAMCVGSSTRADFELRFDSDVQLLANTPNQTIDLYLRNLEPYDTKINSLQLAAYIGVTRTVVFPDSLVGADYRGSEGNFQKDAASSVAGVTVSGEGYFWPTGKSTIVYYPTAWGKNVTQLKVEGDHRSSFDILEKGREVKIATFHVDTTDMSTETFNLALTNQFAYSPENFTATQLITINDENRQVARFIGNGLTVTGGTFNIASTPEPALVGFAGLGLMGGLGWLRARKRKHKTAQ